MDWKLEQYQDGRGGKPVEEFIQTLSEEEQAQVSARLLYLQRVGYRIREPLSKSLGDGLFELRIKAHRIFYSFRPGQVVVLLHAFSKQTRKTPARELQTARQRLKEVHRER